MQTTAATAEQIAQDNADSLFATMAATMLYDALEAALSAYNAMARRTDGCLSELQLVRS